MYDFESLATELPNFITVKVSCFVLRTGTPTRLFNAPVGRKGRFHEGSQDPRQLSRGHRRAAEEIAGRQALGNITIIRRRLRGWI